MALAQVTLWLFCVVFGTLLACYRGFELIWIVNGWKFAGSLVEMLDIIISEFTMGVLLIVHGYCLRKDYVLKWYFVIPSILFLYSSVFLIVSESDDNFELAYPVIIMISLITTYLMIIKLRTSKPSVKGDVV